MTQQLFHVLKIIHQTSYPHYQQNERVERKYRHLLDMAQAIQFQVSTPINIWDIVSLMPVTS